MRPPEHDRMRTLCFDRRLNLNVFQMSEIFKLVGDHFGQETHIEGIFDDLSINAWHMVITHPDFEPVLPGRRVPTIDLKIIISEYKPLAIEITEEGISDGSTQAQESRG